MFRFLLVTGVGIGLLLGSGPAVATSRVTVMTQNQYLGVDLATLATPAADVDATLPDLLRRIAASDFRARAWRQAEQIAQNRPDIVALQESWLLQCIDLDGPGQVCGQPSIAAAFQDYAKTTLTALTALRQDYRLAAKVENLDTRTAVLTSPAGASSVPGGLPFAVDGRRALLVAVDRDVILVRAGVLGQAAPADFTGCLRSVDGCTYEAVAPLHVATNQGTLSLASWRGFVGIDATLGDRKLRFVTTHLEQRQPPSGEPGNAHIQAAQATELLEALRATPRDRALIVGGDFNSSPTDPVLAARPETMSPLAADIVPPYRQFIGSGYHDSWLASPSTAWQPGHTCCQAADLRNPGSLLDRRSDLVFTREQPGFSVDLVVGDDPWNTTVADLWPSNHAGLVAKLFNATRYFVPR